MVMQRISSPASNSAALGPTSLQGVHAREGTRQRRRALNGHVQRCGIPPQGAIQGVTQMNTRKLAIVSVALAGVLAAASVEARGRDDVQFSVTIASPAWMIPPVPVLRPGFVAPATVTPLAATRLLTASRRAGTAT